MFQPGRWDSMAIVGEKGEFTDASQLLSPEELERIREDIYQREQEAYHNYVAQVYDEEELTKRFDYNMNCRRMQLEALLPEDILRDVADIRVLTLGKVSADMKARIRSFCAQKEEKVSQIEQEYRMHYKSIEKLLPEKIRKYYCFHDCRVKYFDQEGTDVIIEFEQSGGFNTVSKIIYRNATMIEQDNIEGCWWICDEIYINNDSYEYHAALQGESGAIKYITIIASDVDMIKET